MKRLYESQAQFDSNPQESPLNGTTFTTDPQHSLKRRKVGTLQGGARTRYELIDESGQSDSSYFIKGFLPKVIPNLLCLLRHPSTSSDEEKGCCAMYLTQLLSTFHLTYVLQIRRDLFDSEFILCLAKFHQENVVHREWGNMIIEAFDVAFRDLKFEIGELNHYSASESTKPVKCKNVKLFISYTRKRVHGETSLADQKEKTKVVGVPSTIQWNRTDGFPCSARAEYKGTGGNCSVRFIELGLRPDRSAPHRIFFRGTPHLMKGTKGVVPEIQIEEENPRSRPDTFGAEGLWREDTGAQKHGSFCELCVTLNWPSPEPSVAKTLKRLVTDLKDKRQTSGAFRPLRGYQSDGPISTYYYPNQPHSNIVRNLILH